MATRRDALKTLGFGPLALAAARFGSAEAAAWLPYPRTVAIDGAGGTGLFWFQNDDAAIRTELDAIRASGLSGIVLTLAPSGRFWLDDAAFQKTKTTIDMWDAIIARYPQHLLAVREGDDLQRARHEGKLGLIYGFQGTESLGEDLDRIALFRARGVRVIQLTHNRRNLVGDGCMEPGNAGLSNFGRQVVERLNVEKIVVDVAHGSARTMAEGIAASRAPSLISHTGCRALADLPRNADDETLRAGR
jgi:membrane dipeptidase